MVMTAALSRAPGALMEIPHVAAYLGQPLHSVRRWIHRPPTGFPNHIRIGRKIVFRTSEVEAWARGGPEYSGDPGRSDAKAATGKTSLCKSLAKDVGYAFLPTTGSEMARDLKALENIYSQAKELRPAFIFIDEADELLKAREYSMNTEVTNKLLTLMDGASDRVRDVIWVAATNHYEQIDPALLRAGRFTEKVGFELPGQDLLEAHVEMWLSRRKVKLEQGLTKREIAAKVGETSIANLEGVLQNAVNRAISRTRDDNVVVSSADVEAAVETVIGE